MNRRTKLFWWWWLFCCHKEQQELLDYHSTHACCNWLNLLATSSLDLFGFMWAAIMWHKYEEVFARWTTICFLRVIFSLVIVSVTLDGSHQQSAVNMGGAAVIFVCSAQVLPEETFHPKCLASQRHSLQMPADALPLSVKMPRSAFEPLSRIYCCWLREQPMIIKIHAFGPLNVETNRK